jgi:hypothetical protein
VGCFICYNIILLAVRALKMPHHSAGLLSAILMLYSSQARQVSTDQPDDKACAILAVHAGGFASNINQILLSMALSPYRRFYIDDTDLKYRCSANSSWDDTFQGSVRAKGRRARHGIAQQSLCLMGCIG